MVRRSAPPPSAFLVGHNPDLYLGEVAHGSCDGDFYPIFTAVGEGGGGERVRNDPPPSPGNTIICVLYCGVISVVMENVVLPSFRALFLFRRWGGWFTECAAASCFYGNRIIRRLDFPPGSDLGIGAACYCLC